MIYRFLLILVALPFMAQAQFPVSPNAYTESGLRTGQWTMLYDSSFQREVSDPDSAKYYRLVRFENGKPVGKVRDFYRSGQKQWDGYMLSINPDKMNGECRHYYQNGIVSTVSNYKESVLDGFYAEYSNKGELLKEGHFKNGESTGKWSFYYPGGKKSGEHMRLKGLENGPSISWYESGQASIKGNMVDGNREGIWETFYENGKLKWRSNYQNGKFDGFSEEYYDNGQLKEKGQCKDGFYDGFWIHYHDNGTKQSEGKYVVGRETGAWKNYTETGALDADLEMVNGKKHGRYTEYYEDGTTFCKGVYKEGRETGDWIFYAKTGLPEKQGRYYDTDSLEGIWTYYHPNGNVKSTGLYERNLRSGKWSFYYETGELQWEENFLLDSLQGEVTQYYQNGTVFEKRNYDQGKLQGAFISYYDNGQVKEKSAYDHDIKNGAWVSYFKDGKLNERKQYVQDVLDGEFVSNYENGNPSESGVYRLGQKTGTWKRFYETGVLRKIEKFEKGKCSWKGYHPNGLESYVSQGIISNGEVIEQGRKKEYYANGQLRTEGYKVNGYAEGAYTFYDSATGKKESHGRFKKDQVDGKWTFYDLNGKVRSESYFINGFRETFINVRDSIARLIAVKEYTAATEKLEWLKKVLKRDVVPGDIAWTNVYRLQADIYYALKQHDKALIEYQKFAAEVKKIELDTTYRYRLAINGQANAYSGLKQFEKALQMNEQLLALSVNDPENLPIYTYNKVVDLYNLNRAAEGEAELIALVEKYKREYGLASGNTAEAMNYLARFQSEYLDKYPEAIALYKEIYNNVDPSNELYLAVMRRLSYRYTDLDSTAASIEWLQKAVDYQLEHGLDRYKAYFEDVTDLTEMYFDRAEYQLASDVLVKGLNMISKYGKRESIEFARLLAVACKLFNDVNFDVKVSIEYAEMAKAILEKIGSQDSDLYEDVLNQLASSHANDPATSYKAETYYKQLIQLADRKHGSGSSDHYTAVMLLGNYYSGRYKLARADSTLRSISDVGEKFGATSALKSYYERMMGDLHYLQYQYNDALKHYTAAGEIHLKNEGPQSRMYARAVANQASTLGLWGKKAEADSLTRKAMEIFEKNGESKTPEYIGLQINLAELLRDQLLFTEAEELYKTALGGTAEQYGTDHEKYRSLLLALGALQVKMGEYKKAEQNLTNVARLAFKNPTGPNEQTYFKALQELAALKVLQKDPESAYTYFAKAKTAAAFYPEDIWYYILLDRYAKFCAGNSRYTLAESLFLEALAIVKKVNGENHRFYASICSELANVYQQLGRSADAEKMLSVAVAFAEKNKTENEESYIQTLKTLALNMRRMGRYEEAEKLHTRILEFVAQKEPNSNRYAVELIDMASLQLDWKRYERVLLFMNPSLRIMDENLPEDHENILIAYNQLGIAYLELNRLDSAYILFKFCVEKRKANGKANGINHVNAVHNLAFSLMRKGKFAEAEALYRESFELRKKFGIETNLQTQATLMDDYGMLYQAWGKHELAEKYWKEALDKSLRYINTNFSFLSDYEKAKFWERNKADFEYFNTFAVQRNKTNPVITGDMYNYRLATKGILLSASNKLRKRIYASRDSALITQYYQWTELRELTAKEYAVAKSDQKSPRIDSLERSINLLEKELSISTEDNAAQRDQLTTWKQVQQTLGQDEAAIELIRFRYFDRKITDSTVYAALVITKETKSNPTLVVLKNGDYLESKAYRYYRNCLLGQVEDEFSYTNFWQPIETAVQNKKHIYISLDGVYNQISLKALRLSDGSFLMDKKDFVIVSNTRDLVAMKSRKKLKLPETASLIGNPKFFVKSDGNQTRTMDDEDRSGIAELPGTGVEIESVDELMRTKGWKVQTLVQQGATEDRVKQLPASRIVHLATHGFFQDEKTASQSLEDPMLRSGVLLTGAANTFNYRDELSTEDGILTAYEAANLSFEGTELVVLSACETARGEVKQGEGVYGLQRAFITAGAESLVMSLWKVDDTATQKLMTLFYQNLMLGIEKSEALSRAQRELKKEYPHPYYWAAFVMMRG